MRRPEIHTVALIFLVILAAHPGLAQQAGRKSAKPSKAAAVAEGQQTFSSICASCHGLDGQGGERGPDIVTRPEITGLSDEETLRILRAGIPEKGMPPFAELGSPKLTALLGYIRALQGQVAGTGVKGDRNKGKELFYGKAGCSACHMVSGSGGFLGPELSGYGGNHSPAEIRTAIIGPREQTRGWRGEADLITKDGKNYSGMVRNEDNFSMQLQSSDGVFHFFSKSELAAINYRKESLMPADYGSKLTAEEVDALAAYLFEAARLKPKP